MDGFQSFGVASRTVPYISFSRVAGVTVSDDRDKKAADRGRQTDSIRNYSNPRVTALSGRRNECDNVGRCERGRERESYPRTQNRMLDREEGTRPLSQCLNKALLLCYEGEKRDEASFRA